MSKGFIAPILFLSISMPRCCRSANGALAPFHHARHSLLCALPWLTIWPWLLFHRSPELFVDWMWTHNIGRWFGFVKAANYPATCSIT
jgi:hypothetical protein